MTITVTIPDWRPASLNQIMRGKIRDRIRFGKRDKHIVWAHFLSQPPATTKRRVSLHIVLTGRERPCDPDNAWKSVLDALVKCGMLVDDSNAWCEITTPTYDRALKGSTTITLEDV